MQITQPETNIVIQHQLLLQCEELNIRLSVQLYKPPKIDRAGRDRPTSISPKNFLVRREGNSSDVRVVLAGLDWNPPAIARNLRPSPVHLVFVVILKQAVLRIPADTAILPVVLAIPGRDDVVKGHTGEEHVVNFVFLVELNRNLQNPKATLNVQLYEKFFRLIRL